MKNKILWLATLLPLLVTAFVVLFMNDTIPLHYDFYGNIDRWGSKYESFIFPIIIIFFTLFWIVLMQVFKKKQLTANSDKEKQEAKSNQKVIYITAVGMAVMFGIMQYFIMYTSMIESKNNLSTAAIDINIVTNILLGIFFIVIGNIMPKAKINSFSGLRTVWSMENDKTWAVSNRIAGISFIISGILIILQTMIIKGILSTLITLAIIILATVISVIGSHKAYKKYK